jgi:hypothetical protein
VTNTRLTDATPAALYAHTAARQWECEQEMPSDRPDSVKDITWQLVNNDPGNVSDTVRLFLNTVLNLVKFLPKSLGGSRLSGKIATGVPLFWVLFKQWLLAGEFSEFEYSCETRPFWRVRVLAKTAVFRNMRDSPDSPTFAKPCCADSPDSPTFAKPCCADSPDSQKASLASFTQI